MPKRKNMINSATDASRWWENMIEERALRRQKIRSQAPQFLLDEIAEERKFIAISSAKPYIGSTPYSGQYNQRAFGDTEIPEWFGGDTTLERHNKMVEDSSRSRYSRYPVGRERNPVEDAIENTLNRNEYFASPGMSKWRKYQNIERVKFFENISNKAFSPGVLEARGVKSGFLENLGYKLEKGILYKVEGEKLKRVPRESVFSDIAGWELGAWGRTTPGALESQITRGAPSSVVADPANWIIGRSTGKAHYLTPEQQRLWGFNVLGQTRYISSSSGKVIPLGTRKISGEYVPEIFEMHKEFKSELTALDPIKAFRKMRDKYFQAATAAEVKGLPTDNLSEIARRLEEIAGEDALIKEKRIAKKYINKVKATALRDEFWGLMMKRNVVRELNITKYEDALGFVESVAPGTKLSMVSPGGKTVRGIVKEIEDSSQISVPLRRGGKVTTLKAMIDMDRENMEKMMIPVRLTRDPGLYPSTSGGMYRSEIATSVRTLEGRRIGFVKEKFAKRIAPDIKSGMINAEGLLARVVPRDKGGFRLELWKQTNGVFMPRAVGLSHSDDKEIQEFLSNFVDRKVNVTEPAGGWRPFFESKWQTVRKTGLTDEMIGKSRVITGVHGEKIPQIVVGDMEKAFNKRLAVGATIAAGALLLWGATRSKADSPITDKDIQRSMYGAPGLSPSGPGRVYTPQARVTPENTGYATNLNIESSDDGTNIDYRALASTLSTMSSSSLGVNRVNTSLHVVDDSHRMDRESTRRSINQHLSV